MLCVVFFFFQAEDGIRVLVRSLGLGDVYKRQLLSLSLCAKNMDMAEKGAPEMAAAGASCFSRMKFTRHILSGNETKRRQVEKAIDAPVTPVSYTHLTLPTTYPV